MVKHPLISSAFNRIPDPIILHSFSYLDSLISVSVTCKYFSSSKAFFWKQFCNSYRVGSAYCLNHYFFYAEHVLLQRQNDDTVPLVNIKTVSEALNYPVKSIVDGIDTELLTFISQRILTQVAKSQCKEEIQQKKLQLEKRLLTIVQRKIVRTIGTLFTVLLAKKACITRRTIHNLVKLKVGRHVLRLVQMILNTRNETILPDFFIGAFPYCSSEALRDDCFRQLPLELQTLDYALECRVSPHLFHALSLKLKPSRDTLLQAILCFSRDGFYQREEEFIPVIDNLVKQGCTLSEVPIYIFATYRPDWILRTLVPRAVSLHDRDYICIALDFLKERVDCPGLIQCLLDLGARVTTDSMCKVVRSNYAWNILDILNLLKIWQQQRDWSKPQKDKILRILQSVVLYNPSQNRAQVIFSALVNLLRKEMKPHDIVTSIVNFLADKGNMLSLEINFAIELMEGAGLPAEMS